MAQDKELKVCVCVVCECELGASAAVIIPTQPCPLLQANTAEHQAATRGPLCLMEIVLNLPLKPIYFIKHIYYVVFLSQNVFYYTHSCCFATTPSVGLDNVSTAMCFLSFIRLQTRF